MSGRRRRLGNESRDDCDGRVFCDSPVDGSLLNDKDCCSLVPPGASFPPISCFEAWSSSTLASLDGSNVDGGVVLPLRIVSAVPTEFSDIEDMLVPVLRDRIDDLREVLLDEDCEDDLRRTTIGRLRAGPPPA